MARDPYKYFRTEARELLDGLARGALDIEKGPPSADLLARLLRLAHTLKGAARVVREGRIADGAHAVEDALSSLRDAPGPRAKERVDEILKLIDGMGERLAALSSPDDVPAPAGGVPLAPRRTVRAEIGEMDRLIDGLSEAHARVGALSRHLSSLARARHLVDLLSGFLAAPRARDAAEMPDGAVREKLRSVAEELGGLFGALEQKTSAGIEHVNRELRQVFDTAEQLRLAPLDAMFTQLERAVRDAAEAQGKKVVLEAQGREARIDADMVETVQSALMQLVRNAVAHGIETPDQRRAAGKPAEGRVRLAVARRGRSIAFTCTDDGRGVDVEAVRRAAQRRGMNARQAERMSVEELSRLLLGGGISTSGRVTELSGRGVGLDVVRAAAEALGGEVSLRTSGAGTEVSIVVPLSVTSQEGLLVEAAGITAVIPIEAVGGSVRLAKDDIAEHGRELSVIHEGRSIRFLALERVFSAGRPSPRAVPPISAVIVRAEAGEVAIGVQRVRGTSTVLLRPLPALAPADAVVAGACLDANGDPQLVLDPAGLVMMAQQGGAEREAPPAPRLPILIIDDSLTTRMLEQSILESAGYAVDVAVSGEEALLKAREHRYALFLVDVEMPGIDGFTFIECVRADPALRDIPSILVTSRASPEDLLRGRQVGAAAYIVKSEFEQAEMLSCIGKLVR